jgi:uncharacterized protein (TIGR02270 family)
MSTVQTPTEPFSDLVEESFDEAAFLWRRWEHELGSPTRNLDEVWSWTEDRLHGALDGVRVGAAAAMDAAITALSSEELDRVTVGAAVLATSAERAAIDALAAALREAVGDTLSAMVRALELTGSDQALRAAAAALGATAGPHAAALCRLKAFRRVAAGDELASAYSSNVPAAQIDALRAARYLTPEAAQEWVARGLQHEDAGVRYAAVESGLCLRNGPAWEMAVRLAGQRSLAAGPCLNLLALFGTPEEQDVVYSALRVPELQLPAIWALGHLGTVRAAEACVAGMQHEPLARACGEAYCWITGANLERDRLAVIEPVPDAPPFDEDDLDANLVAPPEAQWPKPDPAAVRGHWLTLKPEWSANVRHVQGRPIAGDTMLTTIETGPMLRRPDLAFELRVKTRGRYDVETRAFVTRQRHMMAAGRAAVSGQGGR